MNQEREELQPGDLDWLRNEKDLLVGVHYGRCHKTPASRDGHNARIDRLLLALRSGGEGWRLVPVEPRVDMLIAVAPAIQEPSEADYDLARLALANLPFTTHPLALTIVAELARDYRAMLSAAPSPSTHGEG